MNPFGLKDTIIQLKHLCKYEMLIGALQRINFSESEAVGLN